MYSRAIRFLVFVWLAMSALPAYAQQTGAIGGKVVDPSGAVLPGVTVEARSPMLPGPRVAVTGANGDYRLPALQPGEYTLTFVLSGMQTVTRKAQVQLGTDTTLDAELGVQGVAESVTVIATSSMIDRTSATITSALSNEQLKNLPVGQQYQDLIKLIPGVQYTNDSTRGPSAGGSGQDNVYQFDGVNVTLPLFGTLSAEPAAHDVAQVTVVKGGARAIDFDRSGGFSIDSVSKSGSSRYTGMLSYQFQSDNMSAKLTATSQSQFNQSRAWTDMNVGGPILKEKLFFYASYYRPSISRDNRANLYGELPPYESTRNEGFAKVTYTPTHSVLLNFSYRGSDRLDKSDLFGAASASTTGTGGEAQLKIGTAEGSWIINKLSYATFKYTHFVNNTAGRPDNVADVTISTTPGTKLDISNLDKVGLFTVPVPIATAGDTYNAFAQSLITRYGYNLSGVKTGGGLVGYGTTFDEDDFFRDGGQIGYNLTLGSVMRHNIHFGYQRYTDAEDLTRSSNGWGSVTAPGGRLGSNPNAYYIATFQQQTTGVIPTIHSEYRSQSFEMNDSFTWKRWTFNAGLLMSNDTLYGQGLTEDASTLSGYRLSTGTTTDARQYKMYEVPWSKMLQPRLGATYAYNGKDTIYGSYAKYNPAASSLPRAASWDRNLATTIDASFDAGGVLFAVTPNASSSGKLFVADLTPRTIDEYLIGTARQLTPNWSGRVYGRYRHGAHFWEDTNNTARTAFAPPDVLDPPGVTIPKELYIPDLSARLQQIGSGSSYVIAELDGAFTKYYEMTLESEYRKDKVYVRGSWTWSRYYGNFDQDNSTTGNDANIFIGSSNIADGAGRQLWNYKYGDLRGDRRHVVKVYGYYALPWNATAGGYAIMQSGQPWEAWSYEPYRALTTSTSDTNRYAERAGSRVSPAHYQMDLNYTQNFKVMARSTVQIVGDMYNVFNNQTGYNFQPSVHSASFGLPRNYYTPRKFQLALRLQF